MTPSPQNNTQAETRRMKRANALKRKANDVDKAPAGTSAKRRAASNVSSRKAASHIGSAQLSSSTKKTAARKIGDRQPSRPRQSSEKKKVAVLKSLENANISESLLSALRTEISGQDTDAADSNDDELSDVDKISPAKARRTSQPKRSSNQRTSLRANK